MYIRSVELIQVSGKQIHLRDGMCDQMSWCKYCILYCRFFFLCYTSSYCFKCM